jgi:hypothetical protein
MGPDENQIRALTPSSCCGESCVTPVASLESQMTGIANDWNRNDWNRKDWNRNWGKFVGCLTARRRNGPKQAGLSNHCPPRRVDGH